MNNKNRHTELVKKWLADNDSVSQEQLKDNCAAAADAADAAYAAYDAAADAAADAAYDAANAAKAAAYCVKRYEALKEQE
jgi:hypothetical protein